MILRRISSKSMKKASHDDARKQRLELYDDGEGNGYESSDSSESEKKDDVSAPSTRAATKQSLFSRLVNASSSSTSVEVNRRFAELSAEIDLQRRHLLPEEVEEFDGAWGIDPTGEFLKRDHVSLCGYRRTDAAVNIKNEIMEVDKLAKKKAETLKYATDQHTGLEILHTFVLDVLGRDTAAARIFVSKSHENFFTTMVTRTTKMLSWCGVVLRASKGQCLAARLCCWLHYPDYSRSSVQ